MPTEPIPTELLDLLDAEIHPDTEEVLNSIPAGWAKLPDGRWAKIEQKHINNPGRVTMRTVYVEAVTDAD